MALNESNFEIKTYSITKKFGKLTAVNNVNLSIKKGELFSILGPNGAGKTTMIKMLCCLLKPTSGTAKIKRLDIVKDSHAVKQIIDISPSAWQLFLPDKCNI